MSKYDLTDPSHVGQLNDQLRSIEEALRDFLLHGPNELPEELLTYREAQPRSLGSCLAVAGFNVSALRMELERAARNAQVAKRERAAGR